MKLKQYILLLIILIGGVPVLNAQLCTGSLGNPVVNITFGSGVVSPSSIPGFTTTYPYAGSSCPLDGTYTIDSYSPYCFGGTWWSLTTDHTPNTTNGNMMIVNASNKPSDFFIDTITGLCSGTTYEFAAWVLNMNVPSACGGNPVRADITFSIETTNGVVIQQYKSGSIPLVNSAQWKQYGFYFHAPATSSSVVIRMRNNAPGGCGNDLAIDDITLRPCGPIVKTSNSTGNKYIKSCDGDTTHFTFNGNISLGFSNIQYQWQMSADTGKTWNDIMGANNNNYYLATNTIGHFLYRLTVSEGTTISISDCRVVSDSIYYDRTVSPSSNLVKDVYACTGDTITQTGNAANTYLWSGPSGFTSTLPSVTIPTIAITNDGKYLANISNTNGCSIKDSFMLHVTQKPIAITNPESNICLGDTIILMGNGGTTFTWTPTTYLLTPNNATTKAFPKDTTVFLLTTINGVCTDTQTVRINVQKRPTSNLVKNFYVCTGDSIVENGDPTFNYHWSGPALYSSLLSTIKITNIQLINAGNYTTKVSNSAGCFVTDSFYLHVNKRPKAWTIADTGICKNDTLLLKGGGGTTYSWIPSTNLLTPNDSSTKAFPNSLITYLLRVSNGVCTDSQSVRVDVWQRPTAYISPILPIFVGQTTTLHGQVTGSDISYAWTPIRYMTNYNSLTPSVTPDTSTTYYLTVRSVHDCGVAIDSAYLQLKKPMQALIIPNTFSPNGDGIHDYWIIENLASYSNTDVKIFDRNGQIIIHAQKDFVKWDGNINGNPVPIGTYYYMIDLHNNLPVISGWLMVIR